MALLNATTPGLAVITRPSGFVNGCSMVPNGGAAILDQDIATGLDAVNRVTITIVPESIRLVQPLG